MNKRDSSKASDKNDKLIGIQPHRPAHLQSVLDSIPAQIDAIKAEREQAAKELRRFVRKLEEGE